MNPWYYRLAASTLTIALLAGCAAPPRRAYRPLPPPPPAAQPAPSTQLFFYPTRNQSAEQQDRDKFECNEWAVKESGFDPSLPQVSPRYRITTLRDPAPGSGTAAGAITGAAMGAIVSNPHHPGEGAAIGAIAGAVLGSIADNHRQQAIDNANAARAEQQQARDTAQEAKVDRFRRAMTACLSGRGYTVH